MTGTKLLRKIENSGGESSPSRREVWKMFDRIAPRYDLLNQLLSFGQDRYWRKRILNLLSNNDNQKILDLATGTAEVPLALLRAGSRVKHAVGLDRSAEMLKIARQKIMARGKSSELSLLLADAGNLPIADNSFDAVTIAFGIRNVTDVDQALREMLRVLKPGGQTLILEFSLPRNRLICRFYLFYLRKILPLVGGIISGDNYAYRYLDQTVETFPYGAEFRELMIRAGFEKVLAHSLTFGAASIYAGHKPAHASPAKKVDE